MLRGDQGIMSDVSGTPRHRRTPLEEVPRPSVRNRAGRAIWGVVWLLLFRPTPRPFHAWRAALLRLFGARVAGACRIYPSAKIWAPWKLVMERGACLGDDVDCYNVATVTLGAGATVSQYSYLCTASHDHGLTTHPLVIAPITLQPRSWVAAQVFVAPGVTIGEGAVVGARSVVLEHIPPWKVCGGHPCRVLRDRVFRDEPGGGASPTPAG